MVDKSLVMRTPTSYADTFKVLAENRVIDSTLRIAMHRMAKLRNVVVHQFEEVDAEIVIAILRKRQPDLEQYISAIVTYLKEDRDEKGLSIQTKPGSLPGWEGPRRIASRFSWGGVRQ